MAKPYKSFEVGTTIQFTWVGSTAPSSLILAIKTGSTTINSGTAVQSAGGSWYRFVFLPESFTVYPVGLVAEWTATASTHTHSQSPFISRLPFKLTKTVPFGTKAY